MFISTKEYLESLGGRIPIFERLFGNAVGDGSCLIWQGKKDHSGYGSLKIGTKQTKIHNIGTHKLSYILTKGNVPDGYHVMHSCDNPACINPKHLSIGTPRDNQYDAIYKGRHTWLNPVKGFSALRLSPDTMAKIKPAWSYLIVVATTRTLARQSNAKIYVGSMCDKHMSSWRRVSNGECIYCRYEYRHG